MRKTVSWMLMAMAVGSLFAFRAQDPTPRQYLAEIEIFEASGDFHYKVKGTRSVRKDDKFTSIGNFGDIDPAFSKAPLPKGLKRITAPKVRTLEGMEATVFSGDIEGRNGLEVKLIPHGQGERSTKLDLRAQSTVDGKAVWKIAELPELGDKECLFVEVATKATDGNRVRTILIARVKPVTDL